LYHNKIALEARKLSFVKTIIIFCCDVRFKLSTTTKRKNRVGTYKTLRYGPDDSFIQAFTSLTQTVTYHVSFTTIYFLLLSEYKF